MPRIKLIADLMPGIILIVDLMLIIKGIADLLEVPLTSLLLSLVEGQ
jgi:hypothetical protein